MLTIFLLIAGIATVALCALRAIYICRLILEKYPPEVKDE